MVKEVVGPEAGKMVKRRLPGQLPTSLYCSVSPQCEQPAPCEPLTLCEPFSVSTCSFSLLGAGWGEDCHPQPVSALPPQERPKAGVPAAQAGLALPGPLPGGSLPSASWANEEEQLSSLHRSC